MCVSRLALLDGPIVTEAEINPLIVFGQGEGIVAVDALMVQSLHDADGQAPQ